MTPEPGGDGEVRSHLDCDGTEDSAPRSTAPDSPSGGGGRGPRDTVARSRRRRATRVVALAIIAAGLALLAGSLVVAASGAGAALDLVGSGVDGPFPSVADDQSDDVAPGEQFAGAIEREGVRIEARVEERAFLWRLARADEDRRAALLAERYADTAARIEDLDRRRARLEARRGDMTAGEYRARRSVLAQQTRGLAAISNETSRAAATVPRERLEAEGLSPASVRELERRTEELTGEFELEPPEGWTSLDEPDDWEEWDEPDWEEWNADEPDDLEDWEDFEDLEGLEEWNGSEWNDSEWEADDPNSTDEEG